MRLAYMRSVSRIQPLADNNQSFRLCAGKPGVHHRNTFDQHRNSCHAVVRKHQRFYFFTYPCGDGKTAEKEICRGIKVCRNTEPRAVIRASVLHAQRLQQRSAFRLPQAEVFQFQDRNT